jgi:hypothetical protein
MLEIKNFRESVIIIHDIVILLVIVTGCRSIIVYKTMYCNAICLQPSHKEKERERKREGKGIIRKRI